jgi:hypothetical protein
MDAHWPHSTRVDAMPRPSPRSGAVRQAPSATGDESGQREHVRSVQKETRASFAPSARPTSHEDATPETWHVPSLTSTMLRAPPTAPQPADAK